MRCEWASACLLAVLAATIGGCAKQEPPLDLRAGDLPIATAAQLAKIAVLPDPYNRGDATKGRLAFAECSQCHSLNPDGPQDKGPTLHKVFERPAASGANFAYSEALRNSNIVWDVRRLDQWIFNPHETLPGTSMSYIGVRNDTKRRDILAYLVAVTY